MVGRIRLGRRWWRIGLIVGRCGREGRVGPDFGVALEIWRWTYRELGLWDKTMWVQWRPGLRGIGGEWAGLGWTGVGAGGEFVGRGEEEVVGYPVVKEGVVGGS